MKTKIGVLNEIRTKFSLLTLILTFLFLHKTLLLDNKKFN